MHPARATMMQMHVGGGKGKKPFGRASTSMVRAETRGAEGGVKGVETVAAEVSSRALLDHLPSASGVQVDTGTSERGCEVCSANERVGGREVRGRAYVEGCKRKGGITLRKPGSLREG